MCVDDDRPAASCPPPRTLGGHAAALLLERDDDLAALVRVVDALVAGRAGALVRIDGTAGVGKTSLLAAAIELARARGARVLPARASELERDVPLGVVRQLLEPPLAAATRDERARLTAGPARLAAEALDLDEPADGRPPAPAAALHGFFWLCANLAQERALLLTVDDAQWADPASLRVIAYLARRLEGQGIAIAITVRTGARGEYEEALAGIPAIALAPQPLSHPAVKAIALRHLGGRASDALVDELHRATAGNAFLVEELLRSPEALTSGTAATGLARASILRRVGAGGGPRRAVARAIGVLDEDAELHRVSALAGTGEATAEIVDAFVEGELLEPGRPIRFRHPIIRGVVYDDIGEAERARLHRHAAALLEAEGVEADRIAAHLLQAEPAGDAAAAARLFDAAIIARRRGATQTAIDLLARGLREPPAAGDRNRFLVELGFAELDAGLQPGIDRLLSALPQIDDPHRRAVVAATAAGATARLGDAPTAVAILDRAIETIADRDLALLLEAHRALAGRSDLRTVAEAKERLHALAAELAGDTPAERRLLAVAAIVGTPDARSSAQQLADLCMRAVSQRDEVDDELSPMGLEALPISLTIADRDDEAMALLDQMIVDARRRGSVEAFAMAMPMRSWCHYKRGDLAEAEADARAVDDLEALDIWVRGPIVAALVMVLLERGEHDESHEWIMRNGLDDELPPMLAFTPLIYARGRLRIAMGRSDEGLADLLELGQRQARWGERHPEPPWRSAAAVELLRQGRDDEARRLAAEGLAIARDWGTPRAIGIALRCEALVAQDDTTIPTLEESVALLAGVPAPLERAYSLVELGAALRRANRRTEARQPLREGLDIAERCGASLLAARARDELRATGARPRRALLTGLDSLTASERRVAELAASGAGNRQIAQDLFVTVNTIETHMRHVFQKLDVKSRNELARHLGA